MCKKKYKKKGQVQGVVGAVITLVAGMAVAGLVLIFTGALGGQTYNLVEPDIDAIANNAVTAQGFNAINNSAQSLGHTYVQSGTLTIYNNSQTFGLGNFTIDYTAGTALLNPTSPIINNTQMYANYTWGDTTIRQYVKDGITAAFKANKQTGTYLPIIVMAVVISLVLMLVLGMTAVTGGNYRGGSAL